MSNHARVPAGRPTGGQFAAHEHPEPDVALAAPAQRKIMATVNFQVWRNDYAIDVGSAQFDAAPILASMTREYREEIASGMTDADIVYQEARRLGLVEDHDGPFWVDVSDDLSEAMEDGWDPEPVDLGTALGPLDDDEARRIAQDLQEKIDYLTQDLHRTKMVGLATRIQEKFPEAAVIRLDEANHDYARLVSANDADGAQLPRERMEQLKEFVRWEDYSDYATLGHEDIDLAKARLWRPGMDW